MLQRTPSYMCHDILDLPLKSIDKSRWREYHPSSVFRFHWSYHIPSYFDQSVSGRNKCLCCSSHVLCYGCMRLCATHNSYGENPILKCFCLTTSFLTHFTCDVNCIWKMGNFCLLLKHFLRKLNNFCLIKSVFWREILLGFDG